MKITALLFSLLSVAAFAGTYTPPSTAVSKINSYRGYSELTNAAKGMDIDLYAYNMTTWQIDNGGFYKAMAESYKNPYAGGEKSGWRSATGGDVGTIDNDATVQEMRLLAVRYKETTNATYKATFKSSFNKAVNFLLTMQRSSGGLPQVWPKRNAYSDHITLNDNAMIRAMVTMMDIANGTAPFDSDIIDNATRAKMQTALERAIDYLLKAQIVNNGVPTVWCAQHDTANYAPRPARAYELESKSGSESAGVVWFLMNWPNQTEAIQKSVKSAINWYKKTRVTGLYFNKKSGAFEERAGSVLWYRFYEVDNDNYFFCDREGVSSKTQDFTKISLERRTGYQWAGEYGTALISTENAYLEALEKLNEGTNEEPDDAIIIAKKKFDFVIGVDGDFKAAMEAAAKSGATEENRFVIFFPNGEYDIGSLTGDENQRTAFQTSHVSFIGQNADSTIIFNKSINEGISTTATLYFPKNSDIYMQDLTLLNKAVYGNEGSCGSACRHVALQTSGDKFIYKNVKLLSAQDTYYTKKSGASRTYWEGGQIEGTVDFICGDGDVFFEGTNLVMRRTGGYVTAAQTSTEWGYVFNNAKLNVSNENFNGTFYLGRSWGHAKTVFLNTTMYAQPKAEGWGPNMNSAPVVFGEYNSKNGNGSAVDVSQRKTYFDGSKDGSVATLQTVWSASDAAKYTLANVLGGIDLWEPNKLAMQIAAPEISQEGGDIVWAKNNKASAWAIFVNGKYTANVSENSFDVSNIPAGSKVVVRAANSMGGLGAASNEIILVDDNSKYYEITVNAPIGGTISVSPDRERVAEGTEVTFTAKPIEGWEFAGWTNDAASEKTDSWKTTVSKDVSVGANFKANGITTFQAETGIIVNGILESTNNGFEGSGYINFGVSDSYVDVPVYVDAQGIYTMAMRFANGKSERDLIITVPGYSNADSAEQITFEKTTDWTTYETKETKIKLPQGASYIRFSVAANNDGPNLDQIELTPFDVEPITPETPKDSVNVPKDSTSTPKDSVNVPKDSTSTPKDSVNVPKDSTSTPKDSVNVPKDSTSTPKDSVEIPKDTLKPGSVKDSTNASGINFAKMQNYTGANTVYIYNLQGKLVHSVKRKNAEPLNLKGVLPAGIYMMRVKAPGQAKQKMLRVE